jgi:hypothetical protein
MLNNSNILTDDSSGTIHERYRWKDQYVSEFLGNLVSDQVSDSFKACDDAINSNDINGAISQLIEGLKFASRKMLCKTKHSNFCNNKKTEWFDNECRNIKKKKIRLLRRFRESRNESDLRNYISCRTEYKKLCKTKKYVYNKLLQNELATSINDPNKFWESIKNIYSKNQSHIINNLSIDDWFNHFQSVFQTNDFVNIDQNNEAVGENIGLHDQKREVDELNAPISRNEIQIAVSKMKLKKSVGPDGLPAEVLSLRLIIFCLIWKNFTIVFLIQLLYQIRGQKVLLFLYLRREMQIAPLITGLFRF